MVGQPTLFVAAAALELEPQEPGASFRRGDPRPYLPWRIVPHVLAVPTLEIRHPVTHLVEMKSDDRPLHVRRRCRASPSSVIVMLEP